MLFVCVFCRNSCAKEELSLLRCGHGFHRSCRTRRKLTCPKCPRKFHYKSVVEKVFLEMDKSDEENKKSSKSEQADLIENVIKNREQYQLEIEERTKKLHAAETKYTQAKGLLKSTMETVKSLTELEREQSVLQSEVADVKKENWRLRRLLRLSDDDFIKDPCGAIENKKNLLCSLSILSKEYVKLKKKRADIVKERLICRRRIALAKLELSSHRDSVKKAASGKRMRATGQQPVSESSNSVVFDFCAVLEKKAQHQLKIGKEIGKLHVIEKKVRDVLGMPKSAIKAVKSLTEREAEGNALTRDVADVSKENLKLKRLLQLCEENESMKGSYSTNEEENNLLRTLNALAK